jgi:hypothetical protein
MPARHVHPATGRVATVARDDLATIMLGLWLIGGVFLDGWAHTNLGQLETFFTPWHAVLYSGFVATAGWMGWLTGRRRRLGYAGWAAIPPGYELGLVGVVLFGLAGVGDLVWHTIFGIETNLAALLSPTHLGLFVGGALVVTSPLRSAWLAPTRGTAPSLRELLPALLSMTALLAFTSFMLMYVWTFVYEVQNVTTREFAVDNFGPLTGQFLTVVDRLGLAGILVTNAVLLGPVLLLLRRWRLPFGSVTLLLVVDTVLMEAVFGFRHAEEVVPALLAGLAGDTAIAVLRAGPGKPSAIRAVAGLVPLVLWSGHFAAEQLTFGVAWTPELWAGAIVATVLSGLGLAILAAPPPIPGAARENAAGMVPAAEAVSQEGPARLRGSELSAEPRESGPRDPRLIPEQLDGTIQLLFSANLIAAVLPGLWERDPGEGRRRLEELHGLTRQALAEAQVLLSETVEPVVRWSVASAHLGHAASQVPQE